MDLVRLVFDRLAAVGLADAAGRARIYDECRAHVAKSHESGASRDRVLADLEKVIRRQEMQALYEETLEGKDRPG